MSFADGPMIEFLLCSFVIFRGIRTSMLRKPYIFVIFQRGSGPPVPPSGSAHVSYIQYQNLYDKMAYFRLFSQVLFHKNESIINNIREKTSGIEL